MIRDKETVIILAFPGSGRSSFTVSTDMDVLCDSDAAFIWRNKSDGSVDPEWPGNYVENIRESVGQVDVIFPCTSKKVRDALRYDTELRNICYTVVPFENHMPVYMMNHSEVGPRKDVSEYIRDQWHELKVQFYSNGVGRRVSLGENERIDADLVEKLRKYNRQRKDNK